MCFCNIPLQSINIHTLFKCTKFKVLILIQYSGTEEGRTLVAYFAEEGFFLPLPLPLHVHDFVKEGYFFILGTKYGG